MRSQRYAMLRHLPLSTACYVLMFCSFEVIPGIAATNPPSAKYPSKIDDPIQQRMPEVLVRESTLPELIAYMNVKCREQLKVPVCFSEVISRARVFAEYDMIIKFPAAVHGLVNVFTNAWSKALLLPEQTLGKRISFELRNMTVEAVAQKVAIAYDCSILLYGTNVVFVSDDGEVKICRYERPLPFMEEQDALVAVDPTYGIHAWSRLPAREGFLVLGSDTFHLFRCKLVGLGSP